MEIDNTQLTLIIVALICLALVAVAVTVHRRNESRRLQKRFGPEYQRTVTEMGDPSRAEAELKAREKRVSHFTIKPLGRGKAVRFSSSWQSLQTRFVDDPRGAVIEADRLVRELMLARGYPMSDFEHLAADISVDHPRVVENYRAAQQIALRNERNQASTEDMRRAVVHYRALFADLLEEERPEPKHQFRLAKN